MKVKNDYVTHGVPNRNRTCDLPLRRRPLYPTELRGRDGAVPGVKWPLTAIPVVVRLTRPFQRHAVGLVRLR